MLYLIAAYLLQAIGAAGLLAASLAAFVYVPRPWGPRLAAAASGAFLMILAHTYGFHTMQVRCQELSAGYERQIIQRDNEIAATQNALAQTMADKQAADHLKDKALADVSKLSKGGACPLNDADRRWLRTLR